MKNKKRMASLLLAGCMAFSAVPVAFAADVEQATVASDEEQRPTSGTCGEHVTWSLSEDGTLTISGTGEMENYDDSSSFPKWDRDLVQNIVIEPGVTSIGDNAFCGIDNLKSIDIPEGVTRIGEEAFWACDNLETVTLPDSLEEIGESAFANCGKLQKIALPKNVKTLGETVFWRCFGLTDFVVDSENTAFSAKDGVLFDKSGTKLLAYPEGNARTSYTIPEGVTSIDGWAFQANNILEQVQFSDTVQSIGEHAFYQCNKLTEVTIPDTVVEVGDDAFADCASLMRAALPDSWTKVPEGIFYTCKSLKYVHIPVNAQVIGDGAFSQCEQLMKISIPAGVTEIGEDALYECTGLQEINVDKNNAIYMSEDGVLFNKAQSELLLYPASNARTSYGVPGGVAKINDNAFQGNKNLKQVSLPNTLIEIGNRAFSGCESLTEIVIPNRTRIVGECAFSNCEKLNRVAFAGEAMSLDEQCFAGDHVTIYFLAKGEWDYEKRQQHWGVVEWKTWSIADIMSDVKANDWFVDYVEYVYAHRMMNGMSSNTFAPYTTLSRAMVAQILYAQAGSPSVSGESVFSDVQPGAWYYNAVQWASQKDIVHGVGNGKFAPNNDVTREQMAVMLHAAQGKPSTYSSDLNAYADANQVSGWAKDAMLWCVNKSIIGGSKSGGKTYLKPQGKATRAEAATMLTKYDQNCRVY